MIIGIRHFENKSMVEIFSKSLVRAIGKVLHLNKARTQIKTHKGDEEWPLFVNKQLFGGINDIRQCQ